MAATTFTAPANACVQVKCDKCEKTTWRGCGSHVESVMAGVKEEDKCSCPRE